MRFSVTGKIQILNQAGNIGVRFYYAGIQIILKIFRPFEYFKPKKVVKSFWV